MCQILSQSVRFCRAYINKILVVFFLVHSVFLPLVEQIQYFIYVMYTGKMIAPFAVMTSL